VPVTLQPHQVECARQACQPAAAMARVCAAWWLSRPPHSIAHAPTVPRPAGTTQKLDALNQALNVLQSVQLPFALIPVLYIATRPDIMGAMFVVKAAFRRAVQIICGGLLILNLSLVAIELVSGTLVNAAAIVPTVIVASAYAAFVLYLLVGPEAVHEALEPLQYPGVQLVNGWFGQARPDSAVSPMLNGAAASAALKELLGDANTPQRHGSLQQNHDSAPQHSGAFAGAELDDPVHNGLSEM
jgi:hypothetical protein